MIGAVPLLPNEPSLCAQCHSANCTFSASLAVSLIHLLRNKYRVRDTEQRHSLEPCLTLSVPVIRRVMCVCRRDRL